jgi:hypothetical protein
MLALREVTSGAPFDAAAAAAAAAAPPRIVARDGGDDDDGAPRPGVMDALSTVFKLTSFRPCQQEAVTSILSGARCRRAALAVAIAPCKASPLCCARSAGMRS